MRAAVAVLYRPLHEDAVSRFLHEAPQPSGGRSWFPTPGQAFDRRESKSTSCTMWNISKNSSCPMP